jgi:hypothetical protein
LTSDTIPKPGSCAKFAREIRCDHNSTFRSFPIQFRQVAENNRNIDPDDGSNMAAGKIRKKFLWITGFFLLTTVIGANRSLAASPLFFKYWENAQSAESSNEPDKATEQYEKAFRELQIQPWSAGMRLFERIDHLVKFFLDTKHYSEAEQCLKFAITIGGSYKFDQQLADLYTLAGKADLARETEDNMREWIAQNAENWKRPYLEASERGRGAVPSSSAGNSTLAKAQRLRA